VLAASITHLDEQSKFAETLARSNVIRETMAQQAARLAGLVQALDTWLAQGGAWPGGWTR
jgi:hypothetical protein